MICTGGQFDGTVAGIRPFAVGHTRSGKRLLTMIGTPAADGRLTRLAVAILVLCFGGPLSGDDLSVCAAGSAETAVDTFRDFLWPAVVSRKCLVCHRTDGDAKDSRLILQDPQRVALAQRAATMRQNQDLFRQLAAEPSAGASLLLTKVSGGLDHGGGEVLPATSAEFDMVRRYLQMAAAAESPGADPAPADRDSLFDGVSMLSNQRLLRRAALSLAGRLPTDDELAGVQTSDLQQVRDLVLQITTEDAFYQRLREGFNDIFLTLGLNGNADATVLSYEHFEKSRLWYQKFDLSHIEDEKERRQAGYKLAREYRTALLQEPLRLIEHIVRNDQPFTELVTADYIMVSPYTARGYGVFEDLKSQFADPEDPFEYVPLRLPALTGRSRQNDQESATGFYPHAGLASTFQYLSRYPTTETNRNRARARLYYLHFLGVDILELAARSSDAAAATENYQIPTMQAPECVVCHRTLDPVAGLFQDYWRFDANFSIYGRRKEGWFEDMFAAGFEGEPLPQEERWRAIQWLGERTAQDPRFATTMVGHAWYLLSGRRPLTAPADLTDPHFEAKLRGWSAQQREIDRLACRFVESGFNFRQLLGDWVISDFYRVDEFTESDPAADRLAELEDAGLLRLLSPEQLERKVAAVFGTRWGRLTEQTAMLYGGIDSQEVTERATDPSGAMGAIQRTLSNDVACRHVALDFSRDATQRILFPDIEPDVLPGQSAAADRKILQTIVHLHRRILGREDTAESAAVQLSLSLFRGVLEDAEQAGRFDEREIYHCRQGLERPVPDPHYTVRAWRAVVTYLLRQPEFLYE